MGNGHFHTFYRHLNVLTAFLSKEPKQGMQCRHIKEYKNLSLTNHITRLQRHLHSKAPPANSDDFDSHAARLMRKQFSIFPSFISHQSFILTLSGRSFTYVQFIYTGTELRKLTALCNKANK